MGYEIDLGGRRMINSKFDYELTLPSTNIIFEYSDLYKELMESFSKTQKSIFFIIDYGMEEHQLFHPQRLNGTFRGFVNNRLTSDVLANVGFKIILGVDQIFVASMS